VSPKAFADIRQTPFFWINAVFGLEPRAAVIANVAEPRPMDGHMKEIFHTCKSN
jgi:hypothetical protein